MNVKNTDDTDKRNEIENFKNDEDKNKKEININANNNLQK